MGGGRGRGGRGGRGARGGAEARGEGFSWGDWRRESRGASFPRWRIEADRSRTGVRLGSSAKRHHRKIRAPFSRGKPANLSKKSPAGPSCGRRAGEENHGAGLAAAAYQREAEEKGEREEREERRGSFRVGSPPISPRKALLARPADGGEGEGSRENRRVRRPWDEYLPD